MIKCSNWSYIYVNRIYKLYELEYKLSQLNQKKKIQGGFLGDEEELYRVKVKDELQKVAIELIDDFIEVFGGIVSCYESSASEFNSENMLSRAIEAEDIIRRLRFSKFKKDLDQMIMALNLAIGFSHSRGGVIGMSVTPESRRENEWDEGIWAFDQGALDDSASQGFLNSLTKGDFVGQWDKEIEKKADKKLDYTHMRLKNLPWVDEDFKSYIESYLKNECDEIDAKLRYESIMNMDVYIIKKDMDLIKKGFKPYHASYYSGVIYIYFDEYFDFENIKNKYIQDDLKALLVHEIGHAYSWGDVDYWIDESSFKDHEDQLQFFDVDPDFSSKRFVPTSSEGQYIDKERYFSSPEELQAIGKELNYLFSLGYTPREIVEFYPKEATQVFYDIAKEIYRDWKKDTENIPFSLSSGKGFNWYKKAQVEWEPAINDDDVYLRLGDEPDASMIPIDNIFIPSESLNPVYEDAVREYVEMMQDNIPVPPPTGRVLKELNPRIYQENVNDNYWKSISNSPQYGKPYAYIFDGVHRATAAQRFGAHEIKVIRDLGRCSDYF